MPDKVTPLQRRTTLSGIALGTVVAAALWLVLLKYLPAPSPVDPLAIALACCAVGALMTLVLGVEAVAHERLVSPAIDPLAGFQTERMRINLRYLQNTLEQFMIFAVGLLSLAAYTSPRILIIVTMVWVFARWAFWIGYHLSSLLRGIGAPGMAQSMIVLLYVAYRFGSAIYGRAAGIALLATFAAIEALLFWTVTRPAPQAQDVGTKP